LVLLLPSIFGLFKRKKEKKIDVSQLRFRVEPLTAAFQGDILDKYQVDQAIVYIVESDGKGLYIVGEPELSPEEMHAYSLLMENLYFSLKPIAKMKDPMKYLETFIWETAEDVGIVNQVQKSFQKIRYYIARDAFGYGLIHVPMMDPDVEEISCTGYGKPVTVIHRRFTEYDWLDTNIIFPSEDALGTFVQRMAQRVGKSVTTAIPFTDAMSREGHRLAMTFAGEVTLPGSTFCIRKFPESPLSMAHLLKFRTLSPLMASYLWIIAEHRGFIMILGAMGTGKTVTANTILTMIDPNLKIATIEDTPELRIPHKSWQRFKSRMSYSITESKFDVDLMDLVKLSLRYRPDYIVVGEVRGEEIRALIQAAALGHGCLCTFHSESPEAALVRMRSPPMNVSEGGLMLIWCFVQLTRTKDEHGKVIRRVLEVVEVVPGEDRLELKRVFTWDARTDTFEPADAFEVVRRSRRLKTVMRLTGWTEEDLAEELRKRAEYLKKIVDEDKLRYSEFSEAIRRFYVMRRKGKI